MLKTIKQITEEEFNIPDISKRTKKHPYPEARAIYYDVSKEIMTQSPYGRIASFIGRDHSHAVHAVKKLKDTYLRDMEFIILHQKVMDRAAIEVKENKEGFSELEILRQENIELKRKLKELKKIKL